MPKAYAELLFQIGAQQLQLDERALVRLAGYGRENDKTAIQHIRRLKSGQGAIKSAINIRKVLVDRGANVPPVPTGIDDPPPVAGWRDSWIVLGERLHRNMTEAEFARTVAELEKLAQAHEIVRRGISATRHPLPRDPDDDDRGGD